jgi:ADP-heptose:LPS heptosyltransferase
MLPAAQLKDVSRILVIKLRAIGDVLLSTIVTKNLRDAFPRAAIHFLTESPSRDVLIGNEFIDEIILFDRNATSGLDLISSIRQRHYDLVIDLFGNPRTALITRLSGARTRVGYRFRGRAYAYNVIVEPRGSSVHNTQFNLDALEALGIDIQDRNVYFRFSPEDEHFVDDYLQSALLQNAFLVCLNPGGGWYTKRWGNEKFAVLGDWLKTEYGAVTVLAWGPGERAAVEKIRSSMKHPAFIPPPTTLAQLGALLKKCRFMVTNDSGPMHLAAAVGVPVLAIFGPTNPLLQGPVGDQHVIVRNERLSCLGCNYTDCPIGHPCMLELTEERVMDGVRQLLAKNGIAP